MSDILLKGFSIVICTYNGSGRLRSTLEHLVRLAVPEEHRCELILVDNASTDGTAVFTQNTWQELGAPYQLRVLAEPRPGKGYAVETGYDAAQYSYILTVDDDNWLAADYLVQAVQLFKEHPDVGILQGHSTGVFEVEPPKWIRGMDYYFVIGSPVPEVGYFPANDFHVWGAGMVILNEDWKELRRHGFAFLTSKRVGKAAGEDHETAIGILMLGRKIYYSDKLRYKHFMPQGRISRPSLKKGFEIWAYLLYHNLLYTMVLEAHQKNTKLTPLRVRMRMLIHFWQLISRHTLKQHLAYWIMPREEFYQLGIYRDLRYIKWAFNLSRRAGWQVQHLQGWMMPILAGKSGVFKMSKYPF